LQQPPRSKRVFFDRIFHRSYWTWRRHPAIIVPTMLSSGLSAVRQAALTLPVVIYLTWLASTDNLARFLRVFYAPGTGYLGGVRGLFNDPSFSPGLILVICSVVFTVILVEVIGGGFVLSSDYGTYLEAWSKNSVPISTVLERGRKDWKRVAWTILLTDIVTWGPAALGIGLFLVEAAGLGTPLSSLSRAFLVLLYGLLAGILVIVSLIISIFTVFSIPAAIVDQTSGLKAISNSFNFVAHNFRATLTYISVRIFFLILYLILLFVQLSTGQLLSSFGSIVLTLVATPILHSTKALVYWYGRSGEAEMRFEVSEPIWADIALRLPKSAWKKMRVGLGEISRFLLSARNLPFHVLSTLSLVLGIWLGDYVSSHGLLNFLPIHPGVISPVIVQNFGPILGIDLFLNNWLVSIATGMSGIAFGVPSFQTILLNGFMVGIIIPAFSDLTLLLASLVPHGVIEIPSFILSGSIGLKLGWAAINARVRPSPENQELLSKTLRQTVYIVVGLAPLFLVAGLIEGNVTLIIMRWFGWTG